MDQSSDILPDGTYVELVRSLFATLLPTMIMVISFTAIGVLLTRQMADRSVALLTGLGMLAGLARITMIVLHRKSAASESLSRHRARIMERRFAAAYLSFAVILGAFGARAFLVAAPDARMLIVGLLFGYGAGVAAGLSLRPWISVPSILLAIVPTIVATAFTPTLTVLATGALLTIFLAGGIESMLGRYRSEVGKITMRRTFSALARQDHLTGLPNRLSLRERFGECVSEGRPGDGNRIAVHCLDLDRFKPVNDRYGHPVGDALLRAVSDRLTQSLRETDFVARIGGDEFVVVQCGVRHAGEAEMLARRIVRVIAEPFSIEGHAIQIGTSVGYALAVGRDDDMDRLVACADEALCGVKRQGRGIAAYEGTGAEIVPFPVAARA